MAEPCLRVSVLVPCWNSARYVGDAIQSILDQETPPMEVVAVDDGSTDASAAVLAHFEPRVTVLRQRNRGVAAALNAAAAVATGDALAFLDADDLWLPGKLGAQIAALSGTSELDGVFGHIRNFASPDLPEEERAAIRVSDRTEPGLVKSTLLLRRSAFDRLGGFDESRRAADFIAWFARAAERGFRWRVLPELLALRRVHRDNMGRRDRARQRDEYLLTMKEFLDRRRAVQHPAT